jgi:2-keto-3-deoxy-L-rhamnonate aldolase RhmA
VTSTPAVATGEPFRNRVLAGEILIGSFLNMGSAVSAEICARSGFDWLMIDLEHGLGGEAALLPQLHALSAGSAEAIVRIEANSALRASRALDHGARGVMVPRVSTAEDAAQAVAFLRYPPDGDRGVALSTRSAGYGTLSHTAVRSQNQSVLGIFQIEDMTAVQNAYEIAAVDGVDVLFVGPTDLTHAQGIPGDRGAAKYSDALRRVTAAAEGANKRAGIFLQQPSDLEYHVELGFTFVAMGSDGGFLATSARAIVKELHARLSAPGHARAVTR